MIDYDLAYKQLEALLDKNNEEISNEANAVSFLFNLIDDINWLGFYYLKDDKLILGPFNGLPACTILPYGKGVCWKACLDNDYVYVKDVLNFKEHIACDSNSRSELVIPIYRDQKIVKVLDIDSPIKDRFNDEEIKKIRALSNLL